MKHLAPYLFLLSCLFVASSSGYAQDDIHKANLFMYAGTPNTPTEVKILVNTAYVAGFSEEYKVPLWVGYRLANQKKELNYSHSNWERPRRFFVDTRTEAKVTHDDYSAPYQRGHMAPNSGILANYGQMAQLETYFMSNIIPQTKGLNEGIWEELERTIRTKVSQDDTDDKEIQEVFVITGPIFDEENPETIGNGVAVPNRCYKIITYRRGYWGTMKAVAFIMPQTAERDEEDIFKYVATIDEIEEATGIDFFTELSETKQRNLESKKRNFLFEEL